MFKCDGCGVTTKPGEPCAVVVVKTRHKVYYDRYGNVISHGEEIVKESKLCPVCSPKVGE